MDLAADITLWILCRKVDQPCVKAPFGFADWPQWEICSIWYPSCVYLPLHFLMRCHRRFVTQYAWSLQLVHRGRTEMGNICTLSWFWSLRHTLQLQVGSVLCGWNCTQNHAQLTVNCRRLAARNNETRKKPCASPVFIAKLRQFAVNRVWFSCAFLWACSLWT